MNVKKVLIAVDESKYSEKAAQAGCKLAEQLGASVAMTFIASSVKILASMDGIGPGIIPNEIEAAQVESGERLLAEYKNKYAASQKAEIFVRVDLPASGILKVAKEWQADMLVIGRHGLESFRHLIFGGVVDDVAKHTDIPVVLIPYTD